VCVWGVCVWCVCVCGVWCMCGVCVWGVCVVCVWGVCACVVWCVCVCGVCVVYPYASNMQCACAILSSVACSSLQYFSTLSHKPFSKKDKFLNMKHMFFLSTLFGSSCKVVLILVRF